jgi:hypothetical protein
MSPASPAPAIAELQLRLQQTTKTIDIATLSRVGQSQLDAMSYEELNSYVDMGVDVISLNLANISALRKKLVPAIQRIRAALCCQGRRSDLPGAPKNLTFDEWIKSKGKTLGSRSTIFRLLAQAGVSQKLLPAGIKVRDIGSGEVGTVERSYTESGGETKADVIIEGEKTTCFTSDLERVPTRKVSIGDLVEFTDETPGYQYSYTGNRKFGPREEIQKPQKVAKPKPAPKPTPTPKPKAKRLALVAKPKAKPKAERSEKDLCKGAPVLEVLR